MDIFEGRNQGGGIGGEVLAHCADSVLKRGGVDVRVCHWLVESVAVGRRKNVVETMHAARGEPQGGPGGCVWFGRSGLLRTPGLGAPRRKT